MSDRGNGACNLVCPQCWGGLVGVKDTRAFTISEGVRPARSVRRRRACQNCGHDVFTLEVTEADFAALTGGLPEIVRRNLTNEALLAAIGKLALEGALK